MKLTNILLSLSLLATQAHAAEETVIWNNEKGNAAHTGYYNVTTNPAKFHLLWTRKFEHKGDTDRMDASQPILTSDKFYFSISDATNSCHYNGVYALNPSTGDIIWQSLFSDTAMLAGPVYDNGHLYLTQYLKDKTHALITALDANTGVVQFATPANLTIPDYNRLPVLFDKHLYISDDTITYNSITYTQYSFDTATGNLVWSQLAGDPILEPTVSDRYVIRRNVAGIDVLNRLTGSDKFTITADDNGNLLEDDTIPMWDEKRQLVYVVVYTNNGKHAPPPPPQLAAFDISQRQVKWKIPLSYVRDFILADDALYFFDNTEIYEIDPDTGSIAISWTPLVHDRITNMRVTSDMIFITGMSTLYAVSRKTHQIVWQTSIGQYFDTDGYIAIDDHRLYLVSNYRSITIMAFAIN